MPPVPIHVDHYGPGTTKVAEALDSAGFRYPFRRMHAHFVTCPVDLPRRRSSRIVFGFGTVFGFRTASRSGEDAPADGRRRPGSQRPGPPGRPAGLGARRQTADLRLG